jgi:hypothetical protein
VKRLALPIKDNLISWVNLRVTEKCKTSLENMQDNLKKVKSMDKGNFILLMDLCILEVIKTTNEMDLELFIMTL